MQIMHAIAMAIIILIILLVSELILMYSRILRINKIYHLKIHVGFTTLHFHFKQRII